MISSTGVIDSTGAWGCSHQIYYSFSASASLLRIHSRLITMSSSSRRSLKSLQCEEANSYILSMSTAPVISPLLMITRILVPSLSTAKRSSSNSLSGSFLRIQCQWIYIQNLSHFSYQVFSGNPVIRFILGKAVCTFIAPAEGCTKFCLCHIPECPDFF